MRVTDEPPVILAPLHESVIVTVKEGVDNLVAEMAPYTFTV